MFYVDSDKNSIIFYLKACREVFEPPNETGKGSDGGNLVDVVCGETNVDVVQCIHNHTDMTPPLDAVKCECANNMNVNVK